MKTHLGETLAGLTDDATEEKVERNSPRDFHVDRMFSSPEEAQSWLDSHRDEGDVIDDNCMGWRYGYTYTITHATTE